MKRLLCVAAAALLGLTGLAHADDWKLVWADEFNYKGLPDPTKWGYEEGFVRNKERQFYTRARKENARVENGTLVIEARREHWPNPAYKPGATDWKRSQEAADYTAASIITRNKASFKYGRIEVRAKVPGGKGVWPAIWTLGTTNTAVGWPRCGEIDIMEFVGNDPDRIHGTVHFSRDGKHASSGGKIVTQAPFNDFHVYAVEWSPEKIVFMFDGKPYHSFNVDDAGKGSDNPFRNPHYLLLNLAMGGGWGGSIDESSLPQKYLIDYVRVYEKSVK